MAENDPSNGVLLEHLSRAQSNLDREREQAPGLVSELLSLPVEQREAQFQREIRYHIWGVCELLLAASAEASDPAERARLAALTLAGADRLDPARHAGAVVQDLKARAWAAAGEAHRRRGDLAAAEDALRSAAACLAQGTGDLLVEAFLLEFEASLRREQGRSGEAAALLKMAAARYRGTGEKALLARVLADRESILRESAAELSCVPVGKYP